MTPDRVYIYPLREGSDDCWDGFHWEGREWWALSYEGWDDEPTRPCAVWTGTADRDTLASHANGE